MVGVTHIFSIFSSYIFMICKYQYYWKIIIIISVFIPIQTR